MVTIILKAVKKFPLHFTGEIISLRCQCTVQSLYAWHSHAHITLCAMHKVLDIGAMQPSAVTFTALPPPKENVPCKPRRIAPCRNICMVHWRP